MKQYAVALALVLGLALVGCGSNNSKDSNINGTWNATLTSGGNSTVFAFGTSLQTNSDGSLTVSNFDFTTNSPCFESGETETGSFTLSGDFNGNVNGKFGMTVQSGNPAGNTLALSGAVNGNTISGTWTLTGSSGCTGNGTFTMTKV
ncbi:MAG TPA: hypothetical protein VMU05_22330 [Dongiaceae bacterium]|nr:hypothetical protein [Dongiaceae bacterium]